MALLPGKDEGAMTPTTLGSLPVSNPRVTLDGLVVSFDRPPMTMAGGFARTQMDGAPYYLGGLIIGFLPWKLLAMGVYGPVPKKEKTPAESTARSAIELSDDDSVSHFLDSTDDENRPLFSVGFADLSGLTAGVGINSAVSLPSAESVLDFPFVKQDGTGDEKDGPLGALKAVLWPPKDAVPWLTPREGSYWVAAGLEATALTMISADAVLVVTTNPAVQVGVFGVAVIDIPSIGTRVTFAHAEIGYACVIDPEAGTFRLDAQLSPRSFVLHETCHLTGGMALYSWSNTGDFVLTLGGYHQAFVVPAAYPSPPRLGISWSLSDALRISGEAYFAVTARTCMAGGKRNATLSLGPLSAWFDAFLDLLINFRPFKFAADGGLAVGVRFSLDLWLVTVCIKAEIKAILSVLGPPMAGRVHVDFWVFGFDIDFGDRDRALRESSATKLSLDCFIALVLKAGGSATNSIPTALDWVNVNSQATTSEEVSDDKSEETKTTEESALKAGVAVTLWTESIGWVLKPEEKLQAARPKSLLMRYNSIAPAAPGIAAIG